MEIQMEYVVENNYYNWIALIVKQLEANKIPDTGKYAREINALIEEHQKLLTSHFKHQLVLTIDEIPDNRLDWAAAANPNNVWTYWHTFDNADACIFGFHTEEDKFKFILASE